MSQSLSLANPRFLLSAVRTEDFPRAPAFAFAGRSNAGKSSAINALCAGRFARVSARPGHTRAVNFFAVGPSGNSRLLADLPGYGYAAASKSERARLARLIQSFLRDGDIAGLGLVADCRRGVGDLDRQVIRQIVPRKIPLVVVSSKCDKLRRGALARAVGEAQKCLEQIGADGALILPFSALQKIGAQKLRAEIAAVLRPESAATGRGAAPRSRAALSPPPPPPSGGSHP